ncbi:hypothetical protein [Flammeovirga pacifica]|uniref:DUF4369 domain-containing protein n=1 Tax=Flammeovirga pacifica TaxID=915059 RepID=A0A1S1YUT9_FLAPC|nr:hypothetical protein [Flammeovirga pacifica]OHX64575.1 hypothetical protein NH26_23675 [Flammeovirga pacifica]
MKKLTKQTVLFTFFFIISFTLSAQENIDKLKNNKKFEPIKVVLKNGKVLEAYKKSSQAFYLDSEIKIYSPQKKVTYLYPVEFKSFSYGKVTYYSDDEDIYELKIKGSKVDILVKHSVSVSSFDQHTFTTDHESLYVKKKNQKKVIQVKKKHFAEVFSKYFSDHKVLSKKILEGKYSHHDIERIVEIYNTSSSELK